MQPFQRRLLQQNQGVTDVVRIGVRMGGENFSDTQGQTSRPAFGFGGVVGLGGAFHAGNGSLGGFPKLVTGISKTERGAPEVASDGHNFS